MTNDLVGACREIIHFIKLTNLYLCGLGVVVVVEISTFSHLTVTKYVFLLRSLSVLPWPPLILYCWHSVPSPNDNNRNIIANHNNYCWRYHFIYVLLNSFVYCCILSFAVIIYIVGGEAAVSLGNIFDSYFV